MKFRWETEFKETEIGKIPKDWDVKALDEFIDIISGKFSEFTPSGVRCLKIDNVGFGEIVWDMVSYPPIDYLSKYRKLVLKEGDLVIALNRPIINGQIKVGIIRKKDCPSILYQRVGKIILKNDNLIRKYLFYIMISNYFIQRLSSLLVGTDQPYIVNSTFRDLKIPYPPPEEQTRIATVLSWFDDLIENKRKQNEILEKIAMAIFKSWFVDFEPFQDEEFVYNEELDMEIPKGWITKKLKELTGIKILRGISFKAEESEFKEFPGSIPIIRANNIKSDGSLELRDLMYIPANKVSSEKILQERDLLIIASSGSKELVGKIGVVVDTGIKMSFGAFMYVVRVSKSDIWPLVYLHLKSFIFRSYIEAVVDGTNINNLSKNALEEFNILIPPQPILQRFNSLVEPIFQKIILNQKQILTLKKIRDTLLPQLVFGRLRVEEI